MSLRNFFFITIPQAGKNLLFKILGCTHEREINPARGTIRLFALNTVIMAICILVGTYTTVDEPGRYFREGRLMTWISFLQLLAVGFLTGRIYRCRAGTKTFNWKSEVAIWKIFSVGFVFLALDEMFRIHEAVDRYSHKIISADPGGLSDLLDDFIIIMYGVIALGFMFQYRSEIFKYLAGIPYFIGAALCAIGSEVSDVVSALGNLWHDAGMSKDDVFFTITWVAVVEEIFKIYAGVFFIGLFSQCLVVAYQLAEHRPVSETQGDPA